MMVMETYQPHFLARHSLLITTTRDMRTTARGHTRCLGQRCGLAGLAARWSSPTRPVRRERHPVHVQPEPRQFLLYRGSLLNAVLPAGQGTAAANCTHQPRRSILRVSWWGRECWHTPATSCMRLKETSPHQPWMERIPVAPPSKTALWPWFSSGSSQAAPRCPLFAGELWAV